MLSFPRPNLLGLARLAPGVFFINFLWFKPPVVPSGDCPDPSTGSCPGRPYCFECD